MEIQEVSDRFVQSLKQPKYHQNILKHLATDHKSQYNCTSVTKGELLESIWVENEGLL